MNGRIGLPGGGGAMGGGEIGNPGPLRFFQSAIGNEISWMLPFALLGLVLLIFARRIDLKDLSDQHKGALLWGDWLLTCVVFFSVAKQFHAYYMIMMAPPIAVLCGAAFGWVFERVDKLALWQRLAFTAACALTIAFQVYLAMQYIPFAAWMLIPAGVCLASGIPAAGTCVPVEMETSHCRLDAAFHAGHAGLVVRADRPDQRQRPKPAGGLRGRDAGFRQFPHE